MVNSEIVDVVVGLLLIYLLYSLLATIIQEIIAANLDLRAGILKKGISRMLDDGTISKQFSATFYEHPLIKYLSENKFYNKPSYLSAQNFSKVIIDLLRGKDVKPGENFSAYIQEALMEGKTQWGDTYINPETTSYLNSIWADAQGDIKKFQLILEQWFDDTMERVSSWYKKKVQLILFFIGLFLAVSFNVDTIAIVKKLSYDPKLASQLASNAATYMQTHKELKMQLAENTDIQGKQSDMEDVSSQQLDSIRVRIVTQSNKLMDSANTLIQSDIKNANELLGLGWRCYCPGNEHMLCLCKNANGWSIIGWLLTAFAISLGAPFWFDILSKMMRVRADKKAIGDESSCNGTSGKISLKLKK